MALPIQLIGILALISFGMIGLFVLLVWALNRSQNHRLTTGGDVSFDSYAPSEGQRTTSITRHLDEEVHDEVKVAMPPSLTSHPSKIGEWIFDDLPEIQRIKLSTVAQEDNVLVAGPKGSGKTSLLRTLLVNRQQAECVALDPHNSPGKWPCPVIGGGENYSAISQAMFRMHHEMVERFKQLDRGERKEGEFPRRTFVGDEFFGISQELDGKSGAVHAGAFLSKRIARGRKVGECMFIASQNDTVQALGISGNADIKLCFDYIVFLGALVGTRAKFHGCPENIRQAAFGQERPGVVWHPDRNNWYVLVYDLVPVIEGQVLSGTGKEDVSSSTSTKGNMPIFSNQVVLGTGTESGTPDTTAESTSTTPNGMNDDDLITELARRGKSANVIFDIVGGNRSSVLERVRKLKESQEIRSDNPPIA